MPTVEVTASKISSVARTNADRGIARDSATGTSTSGSSGSCQASFTTGQYRYKRTAAYFDLSAYDSGSIVSSATLKVYCRNSSFTDTANSGLVVVGDSGANSNPADPITTADFDLSLYDLTNLCGSEYWSNFASTWRNLTLTSTGLAQINPGGSTVFFLLEGNDHADFVVTGRNDYEVWDALLPKLEFTYTVPPDPSEIVEADLRISQTITADLAISQTVTEDLNITQTISEDLSITQTNSQSLAISQTIEKELII